MHISRYWRLVAAVKLRIYTPPGGNESKYWLIAQFKLRGRDKPLVMSGICNEKAVGLHCFAECDGGSLDVVPRARDAMMYLDRVLEDACYEPGQELTGGKDDRVFRPDRVEDAACAGMKP